MKYSILICLFSILFVSCNEKEDEYVYYDQMPIQERFSENFNILSLVKDKKIDILWVIDNSGSMATIQNNIVKNTALFMQAFQVNTHIEWRMGLISTDEKQAPFLGFDKANPFDHTSQFPVNSFQTAVSRLGTNGSASEYTFYNVDRMLSPLVGSSGPDYSHFFRPDAHLVIIMVTDEPEQSKYHDRTRYQASNFLNYLGGFKDPDKILRFYGAFDFGDMTGCSGGSWGDQYKGSAFEEVIDATAGFAISACTSTFGTQLAKVGDDIVSLLKIPSIPLNARPKVETLEVIYNKEILQRGPKDRGPDKPGGIYYYDRHNSKIVFYNLDFAGGDLKEADIEIRFDIDDGVDRGEEQ